MIYRNLRDRVTGRWLDVVFTFEKADSQNVDGDAHVVSIADALGVPPATLAAMDSGVDQRTGTLIPLPTPPVPPDPAIAIAIAASDLVAEIDKAFTARSTTLTSTERAAMRDKVVALIARAQGR